MKNSPPVSQKIKIEDEAGAGVGATYTDESYSRTFRKDNVSPSPNKRKFVQTRENDDVSIDKFIKKSQGLADNLKKLINEEIENFSSECDNLRQKLQNMLEDKQSRLQNSDANVNTRTPGKTGDFPSKEETGESKLNQISQKIERLMEDIGDVDRKKFGLATSMREAPTQFEYNNTNTNLTSFQGRRSTNIVDSGSKY